MITVFTERIALHVDMYCHFLGRRGGQKDRMINFPARIRPIFPRHVTGVVVTYLTSVMVKNLLCSLSSEVLSCNGATSDLSEGLRCEINLLRFNGDLSGSAREVYVMFVVSILRKPGSF